MKQITKFDLTDKSSGSWFWQGSASQSANAFANLRSAGIALALVWMFSKLPADWDLSPLWLLTPLALVGLGAVMRFLTTAGTSYQIDGDRIVWTTGVFTKARGSVEIFRIRDVTLTQGMFDRMFNVGTVTVSLHDGQWVRLFGVESPEQLREWLTQHVQTMRRAQGLQEVQLG